MDVSSTADPPSCAKYTSSFLNQLQSEWNEFVLEISHSTPQNVLNCNNFLPSLGKHNSRLTLVESLNKLNYSSGGNILIPVPLSALKKLFSSSSGTVDGVFKCDFFQEMRENLNLSKFSCRKLQKLLSFDEPSEISDFPSPSLPRNCRKSAPPNLFPKKKSRAGLKKPAENGLSDIVHGVVINQQKNPTSKNEPIKILTHEKNSNLTKIDSECVAHRYLRVVDQKSESNAPQKIANVTLNTNVDAARSSDNGDSVKQCNSNLKKLQISDRDSSSLFYTLRQPKKSAKPSMVFTYFNQKELSTIYQIVKRLGVFEIENRVSSRTTHLVCGGSNKTINLCKAIARGCWILDREWIISSNEANRWLLEERFEMKNLSPAVLENRLGRQKCGWAYRCDVFANCGSMYVSDKCSQPSCQDIKELILLGSGRLEERPQRASYIIGATPKYRYVKEIWILNCMLHGYVADVNKYVRPKK